MEAKKVSIVILNWNGLEDTVECLESVYKTDYGNYEVIVVDNGSTDGSAKTIKEKFPAVTVIENEENFGYAKGNNIGIRYALKAGSDYVWLVNNDTVMESECLKKLISASEKSPRLGLLSPLIFYYNQRNEVQHCGSAVNWESFEIYDFTKLEAAKKLTSNNTYLYGTALLIKREVIEKIGYLDERYFAYTEDMEYSQRAIMGGFGNSVVLDAKVFHKEHDFDLYGKKSMPLHYFFYTTRNLFWFWRDNLQGRQKRNYRRKYIVQMLRKISFCKTIERLDAVDACMDGIYCAFHDIGGRWGQRMNFPDILKRLILWHPYFLSNLIDLDFRKIGDSIRNKVKRIFKKSKSDR